MAARFWKVAGLAVNGLSGLSLFALELGDSTGRVDATASLFSSATPTAGALGNLQDNNPATGCTFSHDDVRSAGFALIWDFGAGVSKTISRLWLGAVSAHQMPVRLDLYSSPDGVSWARAFRFRNIPFPGAGAKQPVDSSNYNAMVLASSPIAFWPMDETSGTTVAELVAGRNGTRSGGAIVAGMQDQPAAFDPQGTGLIEVPSSPIFDLLAITYELWLQTSDTNNSVVMERNGNAGLSLQVVGAVANPNFVNYGLGTASSQNTAVQTMGSARAVNDNIARHVVVRMGPGGGQVFFDGLNVTRSSGGFVPQWASAPWNIGSRGGASGLAAGSKIAKVAVYDRLLTNDEIENHASGTDISLGPTVLATDGTVIFNDGPGAGLGQVKPFRTSDVRADIEDGGKGRVAGTVKAKHSPENTPLHRRVRLIHERSGRAIREQWSDPITGAYEFLWINEKATYTVLALDYEHNFRAVIADNLTPEVLS